VLAVSAASTGAGRDLPERIIPFEAEMVGDRPHRFRVTTSRAAGQSAPGHQEVSGRARVVAGATQKVTVAHPGFVLAPAGQIRSGGSVPQRQPLSAGAGPWQVLAH
jgi:hypothetical protein